MYVCSYPAGRAVLMISNDRDVANFWRSNREPRHHAQAYYDPGALAVRASYWACWHCCVLQGYPRRWGWWRQVNSLRCWWVQRAEWRRQVAPQAPGGQRVMLCGWPAISKWWVGARSTGKLPRRTAWLLMISDLKGWGARATLWFGALCLLAERLQVPRHFLEKWLLRQWWSSAHRRKPAGPAIPPEHPWKEVLHSLWLRCWGGAVGSALKNY